MSRRLVAGLFMSVLLPAVSFGQEDAQNLTWVRYFKIKPGQERSFVTTFREINGARLDKQIREGKLLSWGIAVQFTRTEEDWTHGVWLDLADWGKMDEVVKGFEAAEQARSSEENKAVAEKFSKLIEAGSVHDEVFRNIVLPSVERNSPPAKPPAYIRVSSYKVRTGHEKDVMDLYKRYALPVFNRLVSDGSIVESGFAVREVVPDTEWTHLSWFITSDLDSLDKVGKAFAKAEEARSPGEQDAFTKQFKKILDMEAYRSQILRIVHHGGGDDSKQARASAR